MLVSPRFLVLLSYTLTLVVACGDDGTQTTNIVIDGGVPTGCVAPIPPSSEPALLGTPSFSQEAVTPGNPVFAQLAVDGETRRVEIALFEIFRFGSGVPPEQTESLSTPGNETLFVEFETSATTEGRFFMEIALCTEDCRDKRFVYTLDPEDIRTPYVRAEFEGDSEVDRMETCINPPTVVVD